jgi:hypothetical protein
MRNIAIGLAAATMPIGGLMLSASAHDGQQSGISNGSKSGSVKSRRFGPRTYGFYEEERGRGDRFGELTRFQRERVRGIARELGDLALLRRERLMLCAPTPSSPRFNATLISCAESRAIIAQQFRLFCRPMKRNG